MAEESRTVVARLLQGIDRYNPENLTTLEKYVGLQVERNTYDLEANLAILKLYQFNPVCFQPSVAAQILLKALTNLPHSDFSLCTSLIDPARLQMEPLVKIVELSTMLEICQFTEVWTTLEQYPDIIFGVASFEDSIRKFICHVVSITYQTIHKDVLANLLGDIPDSQLRSWIAKYSWKEESSGLILITNQEENIKTKNITEKITFDSVAGIMATGLPTH